MLEWYEVGADLHDGIRLLGTLTAQVLGCDGYDVTTYRQLFIDSVGFDPIDVELDRLQAHVGNIDPMLVASIGDDRDSLLDVLISQQIGPTLGVERPLIVKNYPLSQAALARPSDDDPQCAARFELFAAGLELANGYDELRDRDELLRRLAHNDRRRVDSGREPLWRSNDSLLRAISEDLPACAGVALGVDRLLMVRTGKKTIGEVIALTIDRA
jgi:lysyl-tRNA synthetase class 2